MNQKENQAKIQNRKRKKQKRINKLTQVTFSHPNRFSINKVVSIAILGWCLDVVVPFAFNGISSRLGFLHPIFRSRQIHSPMQLITIRVNMTMHTTMMTNKNRVYLLFFDLTNSRKN